jgi:hypothetical protein
VNPRGSPQWVRGRHLANEGAALLINRWTAIRSRLRATRPSAAKPIAMPPDDGFRLHDDQCTAPVSPASGEGHPKSRSHVRRRARFVERWRAASCCRRARFSKTNSRWPRSPSVSARTATMSSSNMRSIVAGVGAKFNSDELWRGSPSRVRSTNRSAYAFCSQRMTVGLDQRVLCARCRDRRARMIQNRRSCVRSRGRLIVHLTAPSCCRSRASQERVRTVHCQPGRARGSTQADGDSRPARTTNQTRSIGF